MKRIDELAYVYLTAYLEDAPEYLPAHERGGWPPVAFFRTEHLNLTKRSVSFPKSWVRKDGTVKTELLVDKLFLSIRKDIVDSLGRFSGLNIYGEWEIFFKRGPHPVYSRHSWEEHLKGNYIDTP